jgi:pSer/pThr/pTyr-binding forkhead associated (FHA) protein
MSSTQVILEVVEGCLQGNQYYFDNPMRILIGRAYGCDIQLPDDNEDGEVSRYHCLLDVDPPAIHVRDLGSQLGTFVNGEPIGPSSLASPAEALSADALSTDAINGEMSDGDELRVGGTLLRAHVYSRDPSPEAALAPIYYG